MIPFAVTIEGVTEAGQAVWVLAVESERLLTVDPDGGLRWYPLTECKFVKLMSPETPQPVVVVQPQTFLTPNGSLNKGLFLKG